MGKKKNNTCYLQRRTLERTQGDAKTDEEGH